jgi:hypothetical protein
VDITHNFSDVVSGFRIYNTPAETTNLIVPLKVGEIMDLMMAH